MCLDGGRSLFQEIDKSVFAVDGEYDNHIYHNEIPDFLRECIETPIIQRIRSIGMNCGCEYTAFPQFADIDSYSRYDYV